MIDGNHVYGCSVYLQMLKVPTQKKSDSLVKGGGTSDKFYASSKDDFGKKIWNKRTEEKRKRKNIHTNNIHFHLLSRFF